MNRIMNLLTDYFFNVWSVLLELAPWLLLGCLAAGLLHVLIPVGFIKRQLGRPGFGAILKAAAAGVPMPLCSCGVIPVGIGLYKEGASRGASVSFLVATPQTAVDSTFVSYSFMGWPFALFKLVSSFVTGLLAGVLAQRVGGPEKMPPAPEPDRPAPARPYPTLGAKLKGVWVYGIEDLLYMIWGWVVMGVVVSAALTTFVPANFFGDNPYASGFTGLLLALVISLPMYACSTASVPIAAGLIHAGLPPGAALVYLVAGPATNVATIGAIYRVFGGRIISIYLGVIIAGSLLFGWLFDFLVDMTAMRIHDHGEHAHGSLWAVAAALLLCVLFARFAWRAARARWSHRRAERAEPLESLALEVAGMSCKGCAARLTAALETLPAVRYAQVDLEHTRATVHGHDLSETDLRQAIEQAGYRPGPLLT
jgi:uncharacterized protein